MSKKKKDTLLDDRIISSPVKETYEHDYAVYSASITFDRYVPSLYDGLKPVNRRILYAMFSDTHAINNATKRKSAKAVGDTMGKYHPHGDSSIYGAMQPMTNWWQIKVPLLTYDSASGSIQGGSQSAMRYTESHLSEFGYECVISELAEYGDIVDYKPTFDNKDVEPIWLPTKVPLLLVNGSFAIAIGERVECPMHSLNDVIDATIALLHDPTTPIFLIPDPCQKCEVINADWETISATGMGKYKQRAIITIEENGARNGRDVVRVLSTPDMVTWDSVREQIDTLINNHELPQIDAIEDHSLPDNAGLNIEIILKKNADAEYVRSVLYAKTKLTDTKSINFKIVDGLDCKTIGYAEYINAWINLRIREKYRLYNHRNVVVRTKLHTYRAFISVLKSGKIEEIVHKIRMKKANRSELIDWLIKLLNIDNIQAEIIIDSRLHNLSKTSLSKYEQECVELEKEYKRITSILSDASGNSIRSEIEQELLYIKNKYGKPRQSVLISEAQALNIPQGTFKVVYTEGGFIRKLQNGESVTSVRGDNPLHVIESDNAEDILLFDMAGRCYRLQTAKIPFSNRSDKGRDIRSFFKTIAPIVCMVAEPTIKTIANRVQKHYLCILTTGGLIKKILPDDILNATVSGVIYSALNQGDSVRDIIIVNDKMDVVVYTSNKALRFPSTDIPERRRTALGVQAMNTRSLTVDGINSISSITTDILVITQNGKINKISPVALQSTQRNRVGFNVIKLGKNDKIISIFPYNKDKISSVRLYRADEVIDIDPLTIQSGTTLSSGVKVCNNGVIKAELIWKI